MSNTNDLVLHLKLDTIIPSASTESQYSVHGSPQVVSDEHFGSCFIFDGRQDYIEIPNSEDINFATNQDFTVASWIKIAKEQPFKTNGDNDIIEKWNGSRGYPYVIRYMRDSQTIHAARYDGSNNPSITTTTKLNSEQFYHIAFVKEGSKLRLYLDGREENSTDDTTQSQTQNDSPLYLARRGGSNEAYANYFAGTIAHLRIYKKALSPEEIKQDINDNLTVIAAFNLAYTLDFDLYEGDNKESIIFIENDTKGEELVFEIQNDTEQEITLPAKSGAVTQNNYHFELRFRPDTLSPKSLQQLALKPQSNWSMSSPVTQADGIVSLYFLTTNSQALGANATVTLTIQNINGAAERGARTTRVVLLCPEFTYGGETLSNYYREKSLSIINHRGKKNIPLHVTFIGSNRILNDGKEQTLILQIYNVLKGKSIDFNPTNSKNPSRFILYFDVDPDWGLGDKSQVEGITVDVEDWKPGGNKEKDWHSHKETQAQPSVPIEGLSAPYWVLTHQNVTEPVLAAGHTIQITLKIPDFSSVFGQTNLYIRYENIPGYWDGTFVCTIEKSPIVFDTNGNVGIGTSTPEFPLDVHSLRVRNGEYAAGNAWGRQIILTHNASPISHVIRTRHSSGLGSGNAIDFYVWDPANPSNDGIGTLQTMTLDSGKVSIGTTEVSAGYKLNVEGGDTYLGGNLVVTGNVGIGTSTPEAKLQVINTNQDANGNTLILGPQGQSNLRLGYHQNYSWIQSHGSKPLAINPINNNVGIGIADPGNFKLNVQGGDINVSGTIYRGGNPLIYENYEIYLRGSAFDSSEGRDTFLKIANVSIPMNTERGLNTVVLNPNGSYKNHINHDVFNENEHKWNDWANWINDQNNVANGDVVAVASWDALNKAPRGGSAETLLTSINALIALNVVATRGHYPPRCPYALLFIKGRTGAMEVCQPHEGPNAHLKTTYYELLNYGNTLVFLRGMIMMWSGSIDSIPIGWALCNGLNGTPDLRDRFILGTVDNSQRGQTGGESSHTHSMVDAGKHSHNFGAGGTMSLNTSGGNTTIYEALDHNHTINSASNLPPYYRMAFIMKT